MKIFDFLSGLLPHLDKIVVTEDLRITIAELDNNVIPTYQAAVDYFKVNKITSATNKELADLFYRNFDLQRGAKQSSFIADINKRIPLVKENADYILASIEELMERDIINEGLTAKKAILVRAAKSMSFISTFSSDLLIYVYNNETLAIDAESAEHIAMIPLYEKQVYSNIANYSRLLSDYGVPNKDFVKLITKVPDVVLNPRTQNSIKGIYKDSEIDPFVNSASANFTGSPIYNLRMMVAEWQSNRYKVNKDKKKMLELRVLHLKILATGKNDPKLEQEINYVQNRIDKINKYLADVDTSLNHQG
jgi:hypothetical protein